MDTSGFTYMRENALMWKRDATLREIGEVWRNAGRGQIARIDGELSRPDLPAADRIELLLTKATILNFEGDPVRAFEVGASCASALRKG